jgi:hypothetical protein
VKAWVAESWARWERDEPEWLKKVVPTIPDEYLPVAAVAVWGGGGAEGGARGGEREAEPSRERQGARRKVEFSI